MECSLCSQVSCLLQLAHMATALSEIFGRQTLLVLQSTIVAFRSCRQAVDRDRLGLIPHGFREI